MSFLHVIGSFSGIALTFGYIMNQAFYSCNSSRRVSVMLMWNWDTRWIFGPAGCTCSRAFTCSDCCIQMWYFLQSCWIVSRFGLYWLLHFSGTSRILLDSAPYWVSFPDIFIILTAFKSEESWEYDNQGTWNWQISISDSGYWWPVLQAYLNIQCWPFNFL